MSFKSDSKSKIKFYLLNVLAVLFLLISNSALWVNRVIFNTEKFSELTTSSLLSDSSRGAIANEVVDRALVNRPIIRSTVEEPATNFISGLLNTSQVMKSVNRVSSKLQIALTSNNNQNIEFDLSGIKQTSAQLINLANSNLNSNSNSSNQFSARVDDIPDSITILDTSKLPKFYKLGTVFMWIAPLTFTIGLILLAQPHLKYKKIRLDLIWKQGLIVLLGYLIGLLLGPLFRPPILSQFKNINLRVVAENLYNTFVNSFNNQIKMLLILSLVMISTPVINKLYNQAKLKHYNK